VPDSTGLLGGVTSLGFFVSTWRNLGASGFDSLAVGFAASGFGSAAALGASAGAGLLVSAGLLSALAAGACVFASAAG
jgi:hypothetical protein